MFGLELSADNDGNNCIVGRCQSGEISKEYVDLSSIIIQVDGKCVLEMRYDMVMEKIKKSRNSDRH